MSKCERPVIITVERVNQAGGKAPMLCPTEGLLITQMRHMNVIEYAWHSLKKLLTRKQTTIQVTHDQIERVDRLGVMNFGIKVSADQWKQLISVTGNETQDAWRWLGKYDDVTLSPVPPEDIPEVSDFSEVRRDIAV